MDEIEKKKKTLNLNFLVTFVLAAGLILLYILFFTQKKPDIVKLPAGQPVMPKETGSPLTPIAFVNTDELLDRYELVRNLSEQLEREQRRKEADFARKKREYEEEAAYFQESVQKQTISESSAQMIYEQLMMKQQDLYELQEQYSNELARKEFEMTKVLLDSVKNYLTRANMVYQYDYILNYTIAGTILHAKDTFDITESVLEGLNREYKTKFSDQK